MLRIVLDTSVVVSGFRSRQGASFALLSRLPSEQFEIQMSVALAIEYESALSRSVHRPGFDQREAARVVADLCRIASRHEINYLWRPFLNDPDDDFILELAVKSQADLIVTHNVRDFAGAESFGVRVVRPGEFLKLIGGIQ